jgi:predicted RNA-binding protein with EMAP domain
MDVISNILSIISLLISGFSYWKADGAKKAVRDFSNKIDIDEDRQSLLALITDLENAKDAASNWTATASRAKYAGKDKERDIEKLRTAIDALRTRAPLDIEEKHQNRINKAASNLDKALDEIVNPTDEEDHWKTALVELQSVIQHFRPIIRDMHNKHMGVPK